MLSSNSEIQCRRAIVGCAICFFVCAKANSQTPHEYLNSREQKHANQALELLKQDLSWIHKKDERRFTPLHHAAENGHVEVVSWLLNHGADKNSKGYQRLTPLHLASDPDVIGLLLDAGADWTLQSNYDETPLQALTNKINRYFPGRKQESHRKHILKVAELYLQLDPKIDLQSAIRLDKVNRVKEILSDDPEMAYRPFPFTRYRNRVPLREATIFDAFEVCKLLIKDYQVDIDDFENGCGYPVLKDAIRCPRIAKLLIQSGADLDTRITWKGGRSGVWLIGDEATALHHAASDGSPAVIKALFEGGVPFVVEAHDDIGGPQHGIQNQTALDVAALMGRTDNVEALLNHEPYLEEIRNTQGALDRSLAMALFECGLAFQKQDLVTTVRLLVRAGANPNASFRGKTMIQIAESRLESSIPSDVNEAKRAIELLRESGAKETAIRTNK